MLAAAAAWDELAAELRSVAGSYDLVVSELTSAPWLGPASASMVAAAAPYMAWMSNTAGQVEDAATQAEAAVGAYEMAFVATVPPPVIAANRALLMTLIATNLFGQNSPVIAVTEAQYSEMWAQDAAAMYGYAGASAAASTLVPFSPPPQTTASTTTSTVSQTPQQLSPAPTSTWLDSFLALLGFTPGPSALPSWLVGPNGLISTLFGAAGGSPTLNSGTWNALTYDVSQGGLGTASSLVAIGAGLVPGAPAPSPALGGALPPPGAVGGAWGAVGVGGQLSASVGQAEAVGRLSVPPSWAAASSAINPATAAAMPVNNIGAAAGGAPTGLLRGMPLIRVGGPGSGGFIQKYGFRHSVMPRPPAAG